MNSYEIFKQADHIIKKYNTRNAVEIAKALGLKIIYRSDFKNLLGMYVYKWHNGMIFLNDKLDPYLEQMVVAHEIGHDRRHRKISSEGVLREFSLFRMNNSRIEYEANAFAAHLLLDNEEVASYAKKGYDVVQAAAAMNSDVNLMLIKLQEMTKLGFQYDIPYDPDSKFFGKIRLT